MDDGMDAVIGSRNVWGKVGQIARYCSLQPKLAIQGSAAKEYDPDIKKTARLKDRAVLNCS